MKSYHMHTAVLFILSLVVGVIGAPTVVHTLALATPQAESAQVANSTEIAIGAIRRFLNRYELGPHLIQFIGEENQVQDWQLDQVANRYIAGPFHFLVEPQTGAILEFGLAPPEANETLPPLDMISRYDLEALRALAHQIVFAEARLNLVQTGMETHGTGKRIPARDGIYFFRWWEDETLRQPLTGVRPFVQVGLTQGGQLVSFVNVGLYGELASLHSDSSLSGYGKPSERIVSPDGQWIATFTSQAEELFLLRGYGTGFVPIPNAPDIQSVIWSPDSRYLFVATHSGLQQSDQEERDASVTAIWRVATEGTAHGPAELLFEVSPQASRMREYASVREIRWGEWSPNGHHLLFWIGSNYGEQDGSQPWVIDVETGQATQLAQAALTNPRYHSWSPDGAALVMSAGGNRSAQVNKWLVLFDAISDAVTTVVSSTEQIPGIVAWSPKGDKIAYAATLAEETKPEWAGWSSLENPAIESRRLYLLDVASGEVQLLNEVDAYQDAPVWQADGERLYFVQQDGGEVALAWFDLESGATGIVPESIQPLPEIAGYYGQMAWDNLFAYHPDASRLSLPELREVYTDTALGFMLRIPAGWTLVNGWQSLLGWREVLLFVPPRGAVDLRPFSARLRLAVEPFSNITGELSTLLERVLEQVGPGQTLRPGQQLVAYSQRTMQIDDHAALRLDTVDEFGKVNHLLLLSLDDTKAVALRGEGDAALFDAIVATLQLPPFPPVESLMPKPELVLWRMESPYGNVLPNFTLLYDEMVWQMQDGRIVALADEECSLGLGGPVGASVLAQVDLAGYTWRISNTRWIDTVQYGISWDPGGYILSVQLPEAYTPEYKSWCQKQVETVIDTFEVVDDGQR